jgi:hypothetical protein
MQCLRWLWRLLVGKKICDLQISGAGQVIVVVNTNDHCDPHIHCWDKGLSWEARFRFSFINNNVTFWNFVTPRNNPRVSVVNEIIRQLHPYLRPMRTAWWQFYGATIGCCLRNSQQPDNAGIYRRVDSASYDPTNNKTDLTFGGGFSREVQL